MYILDCPLCEGEFELEEDFLLEDEEGDEYVWCPLCEEAVPLEEFFKEYWKYRQAQAASQKAGRRSIGKGLAAKVGEKLYRMKGKGNLKKMHQTSALLRDPERLKQHRKEQYAKGTRGYKLTKKGMVRGLNKESKEIQRKKAEMHVKRLQHARTRSQEREGRKQRSKEFWGGQKEKLVGGAKKFAQKFTPSADKRSSLKSKLHGLVGGMAKRAEKYAY